MKYEWIHYRSIMVDYGCDINDSGFINFLVDESTTGLWKGKKMLWYLKIRFFRGRTCFLGWFVLLVLSREWMGCWGLMGLLLNLWIIPSFPTKHK